MADVINPVLYNDLEACTPSDVAARTGCAYDPDRGIYTLEIWGAPYEIIPGEGKIRLGSGATVPDDYLGLFALHYLMRAGDAAPSGEWVSEKDVPSGAAFFRGPHTLPTDIITRAFENDLAAFGKKCESLGGAPLEMGDTAFWFEITPKIRVAVLYWQGDEDFGPEAKLLFDRTIDRHLPLDIIYALAVAVCRILGK